MLFNWYHLTCAKLLGSNITTNISTTILPQKFKCNLCLTKTKCHTCSRKYFPRSLRVNCINCENSFCANCVKASSSKSIKTFLSTDNDFYCEDCDNNFACIKCEMPCTDLEDSEPSIQCDSCKKWCHFKCSKLKVRQFNKLG